MKAVTGSRAFLRLLPFRDLGVFDCDDFCCEFVLCLVPHLLGVPSTLSSERAGSPGDMNEEGLGEERGGLGSQPTMETKMASKREEE